MTKSGEALEHLLEARLAGRTVDAPADLQADLGYALAAHAALHDLLDPTSVYRESPAEQRLPPAVADRYEIEREVGRGGMGVVYLARQRSLNRQVALKVLRPQEQTFGPLVQRFLEEARHLAQLRHPHIVAIHEIGDAAGEPYFTMDYIDGEPLSAVIARGPLTPTRAVAILQQVAAAVQHAHRHGIIHRDLKPGNVLLDQSGHVFVTDFGLARNLTQDSRLTQTGELLGTPQYMAPEQARGQSALIGEATDIHALGLLLFEMLTGRPAYPATSPADVLVKLLHEEPPLLRTLDRRIPRDLETICMKALQKAPAARYANVSALLEDLRRYEMGESLLARRTPWLVRAYRWMARHRRLGAAILITAVCTTVLGLVLAPRLFDKSYAELVAWGDEELAAGNPQIAAQVYLRALPKAEEADRARLAQRIVTICRRLDDPKAAVDLAMRVIDYVPDDSFGPYDYLVAQALVARERGQQPVGAIDIWTAKPRESLQLVKSRLERALAGPMTQAQRLEMENTLSAVNLVLQQEKPWVRVQPEFLAKLPTGTAEELAALRDDADQALWTRGRAAMALGRLLEQKSDRAAATAAYRQAYDLMRRVYPFCGGIKAAMGVNLSRTAAPDAEECQLMRELAATLHRLAPRDFPVPSGGLEFAVTGVALPPSIGIDIALELCDPAIANPNQGLPHYLPRLIPLRHDRPVRVQVLDGTYRLRYHGHHGRWEKDAETFARLLQIDTEDWPKEVEIRGQSLRLPPLRLRLAQEVVLQTPTHGSTVKLDDTWLRWEPVPGAARYQVQLLYTTESPSPSTSYFATITTTTNQLRLAELTDFEHRQVRTNLTAGRTGSWRVDAYDSAGKCIGKSLAESRFLVAEPLPERRAMPR